MVNEQGTMANPPALRTTFRQYRQRYDHPTGTKDNSHSGIETTLGHYGHSTGTNDNTQE